MTKSNENFPVETKANPGLETAVREIRTSLSKQNTPVLETASLIKRHASVFPGLQKELAERLNIDKSTFNKYLRVAGCGIFYTAEYKDMLPAGLSLLYELSLVKHLDDAFRNGDVRPDLTRVEIQGLRISYGEPRLPWNESPSIQADLHTAAASSKRGRRSKAPKIPSGMCAMIKDPENFEQQEAIFKALDLMRAAGVVVYDGYARDDDGQARATASWAKKRGRLATQEVRNRLKKAKKDFKPSPGRTFESVYGSPDELILDGTVEGARKVSEYIEEGPEFERILADIDDQLGGPGFSPKMPVFQDETGDPRQVLKDLGLSKQPKERDFSGLNFDK